MKDPRRLLEEGASDLERGLLEAALCEEPPADGEARLRALLGLSGAAAAASAGTAFAATPAPATAAKLAGAKLLAVWITAAGSLAVLGATWLSPPRPAAPKRHAAPVATATQVREVASEPEAPVPEHEKPRAPAVRSIAQETALLDRARRALADHHPERALRLLDRYDRENAHGVLAQEAKVLRMEVWLEAGERARAERLGARFLREHPRSPHAVRVRAMLDENHAE